MKGTYFFGLLLFVTLSTNTAKLFAQTTSKPLPEAQTPKQPNLQDNGQKITPITNKPKKTKQALVGDQLKPLPQFSFTDLKGKKFTNKKLKKFEHLLVFYYDPGCGHCTKQAQWIKDDIDKFKNTKMLWISIADTASIHKFKDKYFATDKNVFCVQDVDKKVFTTFEGLGSTPSSLLYNKKKQGVANFVGETQAQAILNKINGTETVIEKN